MVKVFSEIPQSAIDEAAKKEIARLQRQVKILEKNLRVARTEAAKGENAIKLGLEIGDLIREQHPNLGF